MEKEFVENENKYVHFVSSIHEFWVFCLATTNILQTGAVTTHGQREREREREIDVYLPGPNQECKRCILA